jgi:FdhD protein
MKNSPVPKSVIGSEHTCSSESGDSSSAWNVAEELPLEIIVNDHCLTVLMRTPGDDDFLIIGHLFNGGLIRSHQDIDSISFQTFSGPFETTGCRADIRLRRDACKKSPPYGTPCLASSGARITGIDHQPDPISRPGTEKYHIGRAVLMQCHADLVHHQPLYRLTRGMHGAALYKTNGRILGCCEDVGRHNAMDKIIGRGLVEGWSFGDTIMVFSGRGSLEMVLKTVRAGVPVLVCSSAPTALAVQASDALCLTLVKPERDGRLTIFTHPRRLVTQTDN